MVFSSVLASLFGIDYSTCLQVKAGMEGDNETVIGEMHADKWTHV